MKKESLMERAKKQAQDSDHTIQCILGELRPATKLEINYIKKLWK